MQIALLAEGMLPEIERCAVRVIKIGEVRAEPYCETFLKCGCMICLAYVYMYVYICEHAYQ